MFYIHQPQPSPMSYDTSQTNALTQHRFKSDTRIKDLSPDMGQASGYDLSQKQAFASNEMIQTLSSQY